MVSNCTPLWGSLLWVFFGKHNFLYISFCRFGGFLHFYISFCRFGEIPFLLIPALSDVALLQLTFALWNF